MKKNVLIFLSNKKVKKVLAAALTIAMAVPAVYVANGVSAGSGDFPDPIEVYNFANEAKFLSSSGVDAPSVTDDSERGKVLQMKAATAASIELANPFAGKTDLIEEPTFTTGTNAGRPIWEKGITISYWVKATEEEGSLFSFNLTREKVMQKDDKDKYIIANMYYANPDDPLFSVGTSETFKNTSCKYNNIPVTEMLGTKTYNLYSGLGLFARFNPAYNNDGNYLKASGGYNKTSGLPKKYTMTALPEAISAAAFRSFDQPDNKIRYGTEKSGLQFNSSGSWGFSEGEDTEVYIGDKRYTEETKDLFSLNRGNTAAAYVTMPNTDPSASALLVQDAALTSSTNANKWHYVTLIIKNDSISTYIDGALKDEELYTNRSAVGTVDANKCFNLGYGYYTSGSDATIQLLQPTDIHTIVSNLCTDALGIGGFACYPNGGKVPTLDTSKLGFTGNTGSATLMDIISNANATLKFGGKANAMSALASPFVMGCANETCIDSIAFFDEPFTAEQVSALYAAVQVADLQGTSDSEPTPGPTGTDTPTTTGPAIETSTPDPIETSTPDPTETGTPVPTDATPTPIPTETATSVPTATATPTKPPVNQKPGDADGNGKVDLTDANSVLKIALGITSADDAKKTVCDVDGSGKVDLADANWVLKIALGIISSVPQK